MPKPHGFIFYICKIHLGILQLKFAYAIMPIGKTEMVTLYVHQAKTPERLLWGFLFRLVVIILTVQPFADKVANHACHDSNHKRDDYIKHIITEYHSSVVRSRRTSISAYPSRFPHSTHAAPQSKMPSHLRLTSSTAERTNIPFSFSEYVLHLFNWI